MKLRTLIVAAGTAAALALTGCSTSVAGSPVAAEAAPLTPDQPGTDAAGDMNGTDGADDGDLTLPQPGDDGSTGDLGDLLGSLGEDGQLPNLGDLLGSLGQDGQLPDMGDLGDLLGGLGSGDASGLAGLAGLGDPSCLTVLGASLSIGMLLIGPALGGQLSQAEVDKAFGALGDIPPELAKDIATLRDAATRAAGQPGAKAQQIMSSPEVDAAMTGLSEYADQHCGGSN